MTQGHLRIRIYGRDPVALHMPGDYLISMEHAEEAEGPSGVPPRRRHPGTGAGTVYRLDTAESGHSANWREDADLELFATSPVLDLRDEALTAALLAGQQIIVHVPSPDTADG